MTYKQALRAFRAKVSAAGGLKQAAAQIGISYAHVSYIKNGHRRPGLEGAFRIQERWGIPSDAWRDRTRAA